MLIIRKERHEGWDLKCRENIFGFASSSGSFYPNFFRHLDRIASGANSKLMQIQMKVPIPSSVLNSQLTARCL
jgi:hypothetical protein